MVTIPHSATLTQATQFVTEKEKWIKNKLDLMRKRIERREELRIPRGSKKDFDEKKKIALDFVIQRLDYFNRKYNFSWNQVYVKNLKTRWGSCSAQKNLNFSYKIIYLPKSLADYLIVHELCHLKEFNHSDAFWRLVGKTIPNYLELRSELRGIE